MDTFHDHLENKEDCIYHKLVLGVDDLEDNLQDKYGIRVFF